MARTTPDFFAAQHVARRRTALLLAWFGLALLALVALFYLGIALPLFAAREGGLVLHAELLGLVAAGVLGTTAAGCVLHVVKLAHGGAAAIVEGLGAARIEAGTSDLAERRLVDVVEEMAIASGVPVPQVFVLRSEDGINALAAGEATRGAVVAVTAGALQQLTRAELQAVVAHEFGHLLNGDSTLNARLMGLLGGLSVVDLFGRQALQVAVSAGRGSWRLGVVLLPTGIVLAVAGWAGLLCGQVVRAAVSRQREYLADAAAAQFTRNPGALASALVKIRDAGSALRHARAVEASHFFFANALDGVFARWMQTHPPLDERIRRLDPALAHAERRRTAPARAPSVAAAPAHTAAAAPGEALLETIGAPRPEHLDRAGEILASLPSTVAAAARSAEQAPALLLALASANEAPSPAESPRRSSVADDEVLRERAASLLASVKGLSRAQQLCAADLAVAALDALPPRDLGALERTLDDVTHGDGRSTVFEWMLASLVRRRLERSGAVERSKAGRRTRTSPVVAVAQVEVECLELLSLVAWSGSGDPVKARAALHAATRELGTGDRWDVIPREKLGASVADAALRRLGDGSADVRRRVLRSCAAAAFADGRVTGPEAELLRVVASSLDFAIPPVLPGALSTDWVDSRKWRTGIPN